MSVYQPTYDDPKTGKRQKSKIWWYEFVFASKRIRASTKSSSKTVARLVEQQRRRELEQGYNSLTDNRKDRIETISDLALTYLEQYRLRHRAVTFAEYAVGHVTRHYGKLMSVDINEKIIVRYQTLRLKEGA